MNKVKQIINDNFDNRMSIMVITYLLGQIGMDQAKTITDDDIDGVDGNAMMTQEFVQSMIRTARLIAQECDFVHDVLPYIIEEFGYLAD